MRFTVSSQILGSQLAALSKVISSKNSMPILGSFLFEVQGDQLKVTASDSENTMISTLQIDEVQGEGQFCITCRTILDAIKELPEQPVTFDVNLDTMQIKVVYLNGIYNFVGQASDEYPRILPLHDAAREIHLSSQSVVSNITRSLFATANDELRPVMNGLYFDLKEDSMAIVASDGHKLVRNLVFGVQTDEPVAFILPKKPASLLKNVLAKDDSEVVIRFDERNAEIAFNGGILICRLVEGRYPNYNSVIPRENNNRITIDRRALIAALRRVLPFASDSSLLIRLTIQNNKLEVSSEDIDFATSAREEIICSYEGNQMSIGFKGSTMTEVLNNLESDEVVIELADPTRAGLILPAQQPEGEDVLMLMMPMLLND